MHDDPAQTQREIVLKIHPDRRVEVDPPGAWPTSDPPPNAAWLYLRDAARALRDCGSAPALYAGWRGESGHSPSEAFAYLEAPGRRIEFARTSILFSAFAAEAYVNAFLADRLGDGLAEVERNSTIDKYVKHVASLEPQLRFTKGEQPGQGLALLFKARNALVHPKEGVAIEPEITPRLAADSIVAVARAAWDLTAALGVADVHAVAVAKQAALFRNWADHSSASLPALMDSQPEDLFVVALNIELGPSLNERAQERIRERRA